MVNVTCCQVILGHGFCQILSVIALGAHIFCQKSNPMASLSAIPVSFPFLLCWFVFYSLPCAPCSICCSPFCSLPCLQLCCLPLAQSITCYTHTGCLCHFWHTCHRLATPELHRSDLTLLMNEGSSRTISMSKNKTEDLAQGTPPSHSELIYSCPVWCQSSYFSAIQE